MIKKAELVEQLNDLLDMENRLCFRQFLQIRKHDLKEMVFNEDQGSLESQVQLQDSLDPAPAVKVKLIPEERKKRKAEALRAWRAKNKERYQKYMRDWRLKKKAESEATP